MRRTKAGIFGLVFVAAIAHVGLLLFLMTVSISMGAAVDQPTVKVSIASFKIPENKELDDEAVKEIEDAQAKADELVKGAAAGVSTDARAETAAALEGASLPLATPDLSKVAGASLPSDAAKSEDKAILAALNSFDAASFGEGAGIKGGGIGPPGAVRGNSLGSRLDGGSRRRALKKYGGSKETEDALEKALKYLASKQNADGSWGGNESRKTGDVVALSSLALLAFLGHGEHYGSLYGDTLKRGADFLVRCADAPGVEQVGKGFGHAILSYALAEGLAVTGDVKIRPVLEKRVTALVNHQNALGGYSLNYDASPANPLSDDDLAKMKEEERRVARQILAGEPTCDLSLLGWHAQALTSAKTAGISIPNLDECLKKVAGALIQVHQAKEGGFSQGVNARRFEAEETMTPVGVLSTQLLGLGKSKTAKRALQSLYDVKDNKTGKVLLPAPKWKNSGDAFPLYRWYYQTQMLFQITEGMGEYWQSWNENLKKELTGNQQADGSWTVGADNSFRLKSKDELSYYATSMAALMLEVYYRYLPGYSIREAPEEAYTVAHQLDAARLGLLSSLTKGIDPEAALLLGAGIRKIPPVNFAVFNGKPAQPADEQIKDEFSVYSSIRSTLQVRKPAEFPQTLQPGQRVALFLDEMLPEGFKWHLTFTLAVNFTEAQIYQKQPPLQAVMNGKTVLNSNLHQPHQLLNMFIPADTLKPFGNVLELRNNGDIPLCFDAARLESVNPEGAPLFLAAVDADQLPEDAQYLFNIGVIRLDKELVKGIPADGPERANFVRPSGNSLFARKSSLWMLEGNIKAFQNEDIRARLLECQKRLKRLYDRNVEPMFDTGELTKNEVQTIAEIFGPFVTHWLVRDRDASGVMALLRKRFPNAVLLGNPTTYAALMSETNNAGITGDAGTPASKNSTTDATSNISDDTQDDTDSAAATGPERSNSGGGFTAYYDLPYYCEYRQTLDTLVKAGGYEPRDGLWGGWRGVGAQRMGKDFQTYYLRKSGREITEWFGSGGNGIILSGILDGGKYYDPLYRTPLPALASLRLGARLFEGSARRLPCAFYPAGEGEPLAWASVAAAVNAPGVATVVASRMLPFNNEMEVAAFIPWQGETDVTLTTGYLTKESPFFGMSPPQTTRTFRVNIENNLFRFTGTWYEMAVFRLVKSSNVAIPKSEPRIDWTVRTAEHLQNRIKADTQEAPRFTRAQIARTSDEFSSVTGDNTKISTVPATLPQNSAAGEPVPQDPKSTLVSFEFGRGMELSANNAYLTLSSGPMPDYITFTVYPRMYSHGKLVNETKWVTLNMVVGTNVLFANVFPNRWNWVTIPMEKLKKEYPGHLRIFPTPYAVYEDKSLSFEINRVEYRFRTGAEYAREDGSYVVLLGAPGSAGLCQLTYDAQRQRLAEYSILLGDARTTQTIAPPTAATKPDAAKLKAEAANTPVADGRYSVAFTFPQKTATEPTQLTPYLGPQEKNALERARLEGRELVPVVIEYKLEPKK